MQNLKKIIITLPGALLEQADRASREENKNRSELIREALILYLAEQKKKRIRQELVHGYEEMGKLSLSLAEEGMREALADLEEYETRSI